MQRYEFFMGPSPDAVVTVTKDIHELAGMVQTLLGHITEQQRTFSPALMHGGFDRMRDLSNRYFHQSAPTNVLPPAS